MCCYRDDNDCFTDLDILFKLSMPKSHIKTKIYVMIVVKITTSQYIVSEKLNSCLLITITLLII
jgi:hypothetical protein